MAGAELYDPATNTWSAAGSLTTTRYNHRATLLPNGKVLVTGGYNSVLLVLASTELYDPATNAWSAAGSMATARNVHAATLLPNGKVLVAGGYDGATIASAEIYDPATNTWAAAGSMATGRYYHTATLLPNGKVLVAGGFNSVLLEPLASAELYEPCVDGDGDCFLDPAALAHEGPANTAAVVDNCPSTSNPSQLNTDGNFIDNTPPLLIPASHDDKTWPHSDAQGDACDLDDDNDGITDLDEASGAACGAVATNPLLSDSDADRFLDRAECLMGTNPNLATSKPTVATCAAFIAVGVAVDTDGDKMKDYVEFCNYNTDRLVTDTDGDMALDGARDGCEAASLNNDRVVNSGDQLLMVQEFIREPTPSLRLISYDVNKDGAVNVGDQLAIVGFFTPSGQCP
jgi:hypothetical protein